MSEAPTRSKRIITEIGYSKRNGEVKAGTFPGDEHSYGVNETELERFRTLVERRRQQ